MGMLDDMLRQVGGGGLDLAGLAGKVGLTPEQAESAVHALGRSAPEPGDTAGLAAAKTGLPVDALQQILAHIGGEGGLARLAPLLQQGGLAGLASGLFER